MRRAPSGALLAALTVLLSVWAWRQGAYFESVFFPGFVALAGLAALLVWFGPDSSPLRGAPAVGFGALLALAGLTLVSVLWTPTRGVPFEDAEQVLAYALAFFVGLRVCAMLGRQMELALLPVALAGAAVGLLTLAVIWTGTDALKYVTDDGTLRWPLGYRNAVAAWFLICVWPMLALAAARGQDRRLRAAMVASATLSLELAALCQSRGSALAAVFGLLAYIAVSTERWRAAAYLALAALPAALALPAVLDVFSRVSDGGDPIAALRPAAHAIALTTGLSLAAGLAAVYAEPRLSPSPMLADRGRRVGRVVVTIAAALAVILAVRAVGNPVDWVSHRAHEFRTGTPSFEGQSTRFGINAGSNRGDFWSVAWDDTLRKPITGRGSGGFQVTYLRDRDSDETPSDPHSVEMLMLSELGFPGFALFVAALVGLTAGALRTRRLGPAAATLCTGALATAAYWLAHASVDWFWNYPALTAPVFALLGAACAPALLDHLPGPSPRRRYAICAALAVAVVLATPGYLAQRYTDDANREWTVDPARAYSDLDRAKALAPLDDAPALAEAVIARGAGDPARALSAAREVIDRQPDSWAGHELAGELLTGTDPAAARAELERAVELNPMDARTRAALRAANAGSQGN